ncbi:MAG TPA: ATP synthase F0 subunit B [Terriglobales bacterium]|nr:ATP synthase F0 subunit B [Terriglobales bacterium]
MKTRCGFLLFALLALMVFSGPVMRAQSEGPAQENSASEGKTGNSAKSESLGRELAEETKEAAGEGENEQFKNTPSVKFIARALHVSPNTAFLVSMLINFSVIALAILWISKKKLPGAFRSRTLSIQKAIEEARRASEEARQRLAAIESRLSRLDAEIGDMRASAEQEALAEEQRIRAASEEDARKIVDSATQEIVAAAKSARRELTAYAADLAVTLARKQIEVDPNTDQGLVRSFADQLTNGSGSRKEGR